jgi:hypothetical protein
MTLVHLSRPNRLNCKSAKRRITSFTRNSGRNTHLRNFLKADRADC